jgi:hypothetical protein
MNNKIRSLRDDAQLLKKMAARLKAMDIEVKNTIIILEQLSLEKLNMAKKLDAYARIENLKIYEVRVKRPSGKRKTKIYSYWYASWRVNSKIKNICLGSTRKITYGEALKKAQELKADCLRVDK